MPAPSTPPSTPSEGARRASWPLALGALAAALFYALWVRGYFALEAGIGHDYAYFFPRLLDLAWWRARNGLLAVPWFTPSFCGGLPRFADGQDLSYALPGLLVSWVDPRVAVYVTAVVFALVGGAGFAALLSRCFRASAPTALLGGVIVALNGAFDARMFAGHLAYHGIMLVPWVCFALLRPLPVALVARRTQLAGDVLLTAFALGYIAWCGLLNMVVPLGLAIAAVALVHGLLYGGYRDAIVRLVAGGALALGLGAARFTAFAAYFSQFRRDWYPLPGVGGVGATLWAAARAVFGVDPPALALRNHRFVVDWHEITYSVGPLPAMGLVALALLWLRDRKPRTWAPRDVAALAGLAAVLALPIAVNVYTPGWNAFLKRLPVLSSSSLVLRWWVAYVFVAPLGLLALERLDARQKQRAALAGVALTVALFAARERAPRITGYFGAPVVEAWHQARATHQIPPIATLGVWKMYTLQRDSAVVHGESQLGCYEPTFGYHTEHLPLRPAHIGAVTEVRAGLLNLKNPACYVWPRENHCRPGAHFTAAQRDQALAFASRSPFRFAVSRAQRVGNAVSLASWALALAGVAGVVAARVRARSRGAVEG